VSCAEMLDWRFIDAAPCITTRLVQEIKALQFQETFPKSISSFSHPKVQIFPSSCEPKTSIQKMKKNRLKKLHGFVACMRYLISLEIRKILVF